MNATTFRILLPETALTEQRQLRPPVLTFPLKRVDPRDLARERIEGALHIVLMACLAFALGAFFVSL